VTVVERHSPTANTCDVGINEDVEVEALFLHVAREQLLGHVLGVVLCAEDHLREQVLSVVDGSSSVQPVFGSILVLLDGFW